MLGNVLVPIFVGGEQANALEAPVAMWLIKLASSTNIIGLRLHSPIFLMLLGENRRNPRENQMSPSGKRIILASFFAALGLGGSALAQQDILRVYMDQARVLKLDRPVSKVIVGNAKVADATVADSKTIVLTGRSFGTTNLVLLDADGNAILDESILVSIDEANTVRVFRQTERSVLSCTPNCEQHSQQGTETATASQQ